MMSNEEADRNDLGRENYFFRASASDFNKIPGSPTAYWMSDAAARCFESGILLRQVAPAKLGMRTGDNDKWLRKWFEISDRSAKYDSKNAESAKESGCSWFPYNKGGEFRKWYGNNDTVVYWKDDGYAIKSETLEKYPSLSWDNLGWKITNESDFFKPSCTWTFISSSSFGTRISPGGAIFDVAGSSTFPNSGSLNKIAGFLCSKVAFEFLKMANPTLNFQVANVNALPWFSPDDSADRLVKSLYTISKTDWDAYETSWDFTNLPLLSAEHYPGSLAATYTYLRAEWREMTEEMQRLEEENNRIFIEAYGLQDEMTSKVPLDEITLTCNPHYQYGNNKSEEELEALLLADTMRDLVSYAVGCMFGRYAPNKPGLILANQGETIQNYLKRVPEPIFPPDEDNVIPMLDGDWFTDDIAERFREFLRIAFGEEQYEENLRFVEKALGKNIRKYFLKDFYNDHVRRYKKRPIYWLFSSPKGSFNALIYMHRYQPHTVGTVLEYLRDFKDEKLQTRKNHLEAVSISSSASQADKTKALKEVEKINKILAELDDYERDVLYPVATEQVQIDLDDGVKANYPRLGEALKKIPGLS
jgi:type II restriction/modification system DNA methylase subunit YeeA